jgi:DNA repair exonuclease SbcCD ATPase subunit
MASLNKLMLRDTSIYTIKDQPEVVMAKCPVCRQPLPKAIDMEELQARLEGITARARTQEKQELETEFRKRLPRLLEAERERARRSAQREVNQELLDAKRRVDKAEREKDRQIQRIRKESERTADRRAEMVAKSLATQCLA